jgi:hypothetical protein
MRTTGSIHDVAIGLSLFIIIYLNLDRIMGKQPSSMSKILEMADHQQVKIE